MTHLVGSLLYILFSSFALASSAWNSLTDSLSAKAAVVLILCTGIIELFIFGAVAFCSFLSDPFGCCLVVLMLIGFSLAIFPELTSLVLIVINWNLFLSSPYWQLQTFAVGLLVCVILNAIGTLMLCLRKYLVQRMSDTSPPFAPTVNL